MMDFKPSIITNFVSYAVLVLIFTICNFFTDELAVTGKTVLILFMMTTCITVLMYLTDKLNIKNKAVSVIVDIVEIFVVVFGIGLPSDFVSSEKLVILIVSIVILIVYFSVAGVLIIMTNADAEEINTRLKGLKSKLIMKNNDIIVVNTVDKAKSINAK